MSVLARLRSGTRAEHERLELLVDISGRSADIARYAELLNGLRSVYAPLERQLDASPWTPQALPDWRLRRKRDWLDEDLAALSTLPGRDAPVPRVSSLEQVVGAAYVMEGATLGGGVVSRLLPAGLPSRFFTSYGARRGAMWRTFRARVDSLPELDHDETLAAARSTFTAFAAPYAGAS